MAELARSPGDIASRKRQRLHARAAMPTHSRTGCGSGATRLRGHCGETLLSLRARSGSATDAALTLGGRDAKRHCGDFTLGTGVFRQARGRTNHFIAC